MTITNVKIRRLLDDRKLRAIVSVTFDDQLVIHDIKIIAGEGRLFLAMPSRLLPNGQHADIAHPIGNELRHTIETTVLAEYNRQIS